MMEPKNSELYKRLVETARVIAWEADLSTGQFTYVSPQARDILGYEPEEWLTHDFWPKHIFAEDRDEALRTCIENSKTQTHYEFDYRMVTKSGQIAWIRDIVSVVKLADGRKILSGYMLDITERKQIEAQLRKALAARDEFLSVCSHELKTPLTSLYLQAQVLRRNIERGDPHTLSQANLLRVAEQSELQSIRLSRLVDDMLDVSRISSGKFSLQKERVKLDAIIQETVQRLEAQLLHHHGDFKIQLQSDVEILGDSFRLEQVITNLLTNSMRYAPGKPIEISLMSQGHNARLCVRDYGRGIPSECQQLIFERFERILSSHQVSGLGLGLFICREIVAAHGGRIWVESEAGQGAAFFVEIPLLQNQI